MTVEEAVFSRRSVRAYLGKPVPREAIEKVMKAAAYAPSALNNQARQFVALSDAELLGELNEAVKSIVSPATAERITSRSKDGKFDFFYGAPVLIVALDSPNELYPQCDSACALENMFLMAHSLGLGTCWINQLVGNDLSPAVRRVLDKAGAREDYRVYGCCALGYPAGPVKAEPSRPKTNEIIIK